ncbi:MAG: glycosyltransferase family 2 protein [Planctomycetota bacterium]
MPDLLSVLMPFYNERGTLEEIVRRVLASEPGVPVELVMVDDCSADGSGEIAEKLAESDERIRLVRHDANRGKGAAVRSAIAAAAGTIAVIQDADFEYDPGDYAALIAPILAGEADAVYGSRFLGGSPEGALGSSVLANNLLTKLSNLVNGLGLSDMETCYKAVRTGLLKSLHLTSDRFGIEPEITARLAQAKARIVEVPISYNPRSYAEGKKIRWRDGAAAIWHILKFRFKS